MTTKKQKREAGLAKHAAWVEEQKVSGLKAQQSDQQNRKNKLRDSQREKHDKNHSWKQLDKDCILCQDRLEEARRQQKAMEESNDG